LFADKHQWRWVVFGGPLSREEEWQNLQEAVQGTDIKLIKYWPMLAEVINATDLFIGTCGYNLSAEIIATGTPAIFIPIPRKEAEQTIRAEILRQHDMGQVVPFQQQETEQELAHLLSDWLAKPKSAKQTPKINTDGAEFVASCIEEDLRQAAQ
jgi:predicted glycosyltransferase